MLVKFENPVYWLAILSGLKLILSSNGIQLITDSQVNLIANGLAAIITVAAGAIALYQGKVTAAEIKALKQKLSATAK
jgi:uncharacterized membrane protein